jgi:RNA polymerase sigma-70 factor (ECF subfamily)
LTRTAAIEKTAGQPGPGESELIRRILAGERELYYDLVSPHERVAYLSAFSVLRNEADAEDCAQEAILKALRHLAEFRGESKFGSWLVRITLNEAKMKLRKLRPNQYESLDEGADSEDGEYVPQTLSDWREIPSETLERKEVRKALVDAVSKLPEIYREVFVLRDVQHQDIATTAQILGVTEAVVKTRLLRARLQMRDLVSPLMKSSNIFSRPAFRKGNNPWL